MEMFKKFELSTIVSSKLIGGTDGNTSEDAPITTLGTITNEGEG